MGYRLLVGIFAAVLMAGCAAFDDDNTPYEGMKPGEPLPFVGTNLYSGYYIGDLTVESNECATVVDEAGSVVEIGFEVVQKDATINLIFEDGTAGAGTLDGDKVTVMTEASGVKSVYYLTFADGKIEGSVEVIEPDASGQYGKPCSTATFSLAKGDKPEPEGSVEEECGEGEVCADTGAAPLSSRGEMHFK